MLDYSEGLTKENAKERLETVKEFMRAKEDALTAYAHDDHMVDRLNDQLHEYAFMKEQIELFIKRNKL